MAKRTVVEAVPAITVPVVPVDATPAPTTPVEAPKTFTLQYRRQHPGGGPQGRCSYGVPGVPGIVVFDMGMFANGVAPATIVLNVELAQPVARKVAGVTSAVVAGANSTAAQVAGVAIAGPAAVAAVAAVVGAAVVDAAVATKAS